MKIPSPGEVNVCQECRHQTWLLVLSERPYSLGPNASFCINCGIIGDSNVTTIASEDALGRHPHGFYLIGVCSKCGKAIGLKLDEEGMGIEPIQPLCGGCGSLSGGEVIGIFGGANDQIYPKPCPWCEAMVAWDIEGCIPSGHHGPVTRYCIWCHKPVSVYDGGALRKQE